MGSQTISEEKEKKFMSKKIQYWNGSEWEEKDESCFPVVDFKDILRIFWRGDKEIEAEYQKEENIESRFYQNVCGTYVLDYVL